MCPNIFIFAQDLSKENFPHLRFFILDKYWTRNCPIFVQVLSMKCWELATELFAKFVKIVSMSNFFCPTFVKYKYMLMVLSIVLEISPIFVHFGHRQNLDKYWTKTGQSLDACLTLNNCISNFTPSKESTLTIKYQHWLLLLDVPADQWHLIK